jgi:hypothetical protein
MAKLARKMLLLFFCVNFGGLRGRGSCASAESYWGKVNPVGLRLCCDEKKRFV